MEDLVKRIIDYIRIDFSSVKIKINTLNIPVSTLLEWLRNGQIEIDEDIQRQYVWDSVTASRWIESLLFDLPVPPIILAEIDGRYIVLDGVQRIRTIQWFVDGIRDEKRQGKLRLHGVCTTQIEGKTYDTLPEALRKKFNLKGIPALLISVEEPKDSRRKLEVLLEIFRRLNLGSYRLTVTQVLLCSVKTPCVTAIKRVGKSEYMREIFEFTSSEIKRMLHYYIALSFFMCLRKSKVLNLSATGKAKYMKDIVNLLLYSNENEVALLERETMDTLYLLSRIGFRREYFDPYCYGIYTQKRFISVIIADIIFCAIHNLKRNVGFENLVSKSHQILTATKEFFKPYNVIGRFPDIRDRVMTVRDALIDSSRLGRQDLVDMLYEEYVRYLKRRALMLE